MREIERQIAEAERLLNEKVLSIIVAQRKGGDVTDAKACVREMHRALALLYAQHRKAERQTSGPVTRGKSLHRA